VDVWFVKVVPGKGRRNAGGKVGAPVRIFLRAAMLIVTPSLYSPETMVE